MSGKLPLKTGHLFLLGAIVMAVITGVLMMGLMKKGTTSKARAPEVKTQSVLVASQFIPAGTQLANFHFKKVDWPQKFLVKNDYYTKSNELVGRTLRGDLLPGEIIYRQKLSGDTSRGGMPVLIPKGMRAIAVGVSEVKGVAGFVKPGDKVDVLGTFEVRDDEGERHYVTRTIIQNAIVMASAQTMVDETDVQVREPEGLKAPLEKKADKKKSARELRKERKEREKARREKEKRARKISSVTLAVWPEQVEKLALAQEFGELYLALRPEGDEQVVSVKGAKSEQILRESTEGSWPFNAKKPEAPVEAPSTATLQVEVIQGTSRSSVSF